jgi:hypothetical protein
MHQALRTADWRSIGALTLILGVTAAVYAGSLDNDFVHDDWASVANNESLKGLGNLGRFFVEPALFAQGGPSSHTRPVLLVTFAINRAIADDAFGFRLVNLLIHLINVVLLYLLVGRVLRLAQVDERVAGVRLLTAAIFAVHPLNTQAVVYVSSRSALLAFTFIVAGMLLFLKWRSSFGSPEGPRVPALLGCLAMASLAMLTKEHAVSFLGAVVLLEVCLFQARQRSPRGLLASVAVATLPVVSYLIYRAIVIEPTPTSGVFHSTSVSGPYVWHLATQTKALVAYLVLFVWPWKLAIQHTLAPVRSFLDPGFLVSAGAIVASVVWAVPRWVRGNLVALAVLWYFAAMGPESLVRLNLLVNEHRFYLPGIGIVAILAWVVVRAYEKLAVMRRGRMVAVGLVTLLILGLGYRSYRYAGHWRDECSLWEYTATVQPDHTWTQNNVGNCRLLGNDLVGAERAYRRALELAPDNALALYNTAVVSARQGRYEEAIRLLREFDEKTAGKMSAKTEKMIEDLRRRLPASSERP